MTLKRIGNFAYVVSYQSPWRKTKNYLLRMEKEGERRRRIETTFASRNSFKPSVIEGFDQYRLMQISTVHLLKINWAISSPADIKSFDAQFEFNKYKAFQFYDNFCLTHSARNVIFFIKFWRVVKVVCLDFVKRQWHLVCPLKHIANTSPGTESS